MKLLEKILTAHKMKHEVNASLETDGELCIVLHDHYETYPRVSVFCGGDTGNIAHFEINEGGIKAVNWDSFTGSLTEAKELLEALMLKET